MLFPQDVLQRIVRGEVTLQFRRWRRAPPKPGDTQLTQLGVVAFEAVDVVDEGEISDADARASGAASRDDLLSSLAPHGTLLRIRVRYAGPDPRAALRQQVADASESDGLREQLQRLDRRAGAPWTRLYLAAIRDAPGVPARVLAMRAGIETLPFKQRVRRLKALGLTESLEVGYRLSPRGAGLLAGLESGGA